MASLATLFSLRHSGLVLFRTGCSSLLLATFTGAMIKFIWEYLFPGLIYPTVFEVQLIAFVVTFFVSCPVLYTLFFMASRVSRKNHELFELANLDPLTGLDNRRALAEKFSMLLRKARRNHKTGLLLVIDVDKFKDINDHFGHETGDNVLKHLSGNLRTLAGPDCCIARLGGEEFAVACFEVQHDGAFQFAEKIRKGIQNSALQLADREIAYTVSIGYCLVQENNFLNEVMRNADSALYTAKRTGRNRTICFDPTLVPLAPDAEDLLQAGDKTVSNHAASSK